MGARPFEFSRWAAWGPPTGLDETGREFESPSALEVGFSLVPASPCLSLTRSPRKTGIGARSLQGFQSTLDRLQSRGAPSRRLLVRRLP